jgi:hypothetical protein
MNRKLAVFAAAIAVFAFACQSADAGSRKEIDPRIVGTEIGVGAASTGAYFALKGHHGGGLNWGAWGAATFGCAVVSPMVATVVLNRPLSYREAHILIGSCVVPLVGGWLVNEAYNAHILWAPDEKVSMTKHRRAKK